MSYVKSPEILVGHLTQERSIHYRFRGSDDDLRSKFEEYICSALSTMKYADYVASGQTTVPIPGGKRLSKFGDSVSATER
jgi:hypothetical protein